jgi:hypothetical protein
MIKTNTRDLINKRKCFVLTDNLEAFCSSKSNYLHLCICSVGQDTLDAAPHGKN